jgi:hypothetical protein
VGLLNPLISLEAQLIDFPVFFIASPKSSPRARTFGENQSVLANWFNLIA